MKCEEVQSHFSDYLDKTAEGPRAKGIENHLTNCPICSEDFAGLLQCRQMIAALPDVEPPVGFTMRVMANVAEAASETSLWRRLFTPLKFKLPLQATAVMLIGILTFYVYEKADYNKGPLPAAPENFSSLSNRVTVTPNNADQASPAEQIEETLPQTANAPRTATPEKTVPAARPVSDPAPAATPTVSDTSSQPAAEARKSSPIQAQGVVAGLGVSGSIRIPRQPPFRLFPADREFVNLGEPIADYEILVRAGARRARTLESSASSAEKSARPEGPSSAAEGNALIDLPASSVLNILWYTVPQDQYEKFKTELAAQARIESEIPIGIRDKASSFRSDGPLFIKVVVLAPSE